MPQTEKDAKTYYVYILRCKDDSLYTGITTDIKRRLREHEQRGARCAKYTLSHHAVKAEAVWQTYGRVRASRLEYRIKRLSKQEKEALIAGMLALPEGMQDYERCEIKI